jgi:hypothetical protein
LVRQRLRFHAYRVSTDCVAMQGVC